MRPLVILIAMIATTHCTVSGTDMSKPPAVPTTEPASHSVFGDRVLRYDFALASTHPDPLASTNGVERYIPARLSVSGEVVGTVGIRSVGEERGDRLPADCENGGEGCGRRAFKVKFDHVDPDRRFHGLRRLNFGADPQDPSRLRERLALELFRRMDLPVPRAALALVTVNGVPRGVFTVVEEVDAAFVSERWQQLDEGNLYKDAWPAATNPDEYTPALRTNVAVANNQLIAAFASALQRSGSDEELARTVAAFTDTEQLSRYLVVDQAVNNEEGIRTFHCQGAEGCANQNYFWYQIPGDDRLLLIPWQLSATFALRTALDDLPPWNRTAGDCAHRPTVHPDDPLWPPGCDPLFRGLAIAGEAHAQALELLLDRWDVQSLRALLGHWQRELAPVVALDPTGTGPIAWRAAVQRLGVVLAALRERLAGLRAGETPAAFALAVSGRNGLEHTSALAFHLGARSESNPASAEVLDLSREGALSGQQDVLFAFELANDPPATAPPRARAPYAQLRLPLAGGTVDLSGLKRIRMKLAADRVRSVRIEIDSPLHEAADPPVRYGREFIVGKQRTELILVSSDLAPADRAAPPGRTLAEVLAAVSALIVSPTALLADADGLLPEGRTEPGFVRVDDIDIESI
jgi:CotH kinase protein